MYAGLVTGRVSGGTLEVKGDFFSNAITITPGAVPFSVKVTGINDNNGLPTTVNGVSNGAITFKNVIHGMKVDLGAGNNILNVNGVTIFGKVSLKTGNGVDAVALATNLLKSDLTIKTGRSMDTVSITNTTVLGTARIKTGTGSDVLTINNQPNVNSIGALKVDLGRGNDIATFTGVSVVTKSNLQGGPGIDLLNNGISNFYGGTIVHGGFQSGWGG
jgi:hypothetical protein